ncbi:MAG: hypothetical protein LBJ64_01380, partial [Deltaproteobacteria bacterium]|nr:hypothetical protein [Deltaproteobacteria bacterium]
RSGRQLHSGSSDGTQGGPASDPPTDRSDSDRPGSDDGFFPADYRLKDDLRDYERRKIISAVRANNGNVNKSASCLGVSQQLLVYKIKKLGINKDLI